jgi:uridylate kinase
MLGTTMNALAIGDAFKQVGQPVRVQTGVEMRQIAEFYIKDRATRHLDKGRVVVFGCGTGSPFFSTDTAAALRAAEIGADAVLKATNVDAIYDKDPKKYDDAELIEEITASDMMGIISGNDVKAGTYEFIDTTAIQMIKRSNLETVIANGNEPQNLIRAIKGEKIGTRVISE